MANAIESVPHTHTHKSAPITNQKKKQQNFFISQIPWTSLFLFSSSSFVLHCSNRWTVCTHTSSRTQDQFINTYMMGSRLYGFSRPPQLPSPPTPPTNRRQPLSCVQTICSSWLNCIGVCVADQHDYHLYYTFRIPAWHSQRLNCARNISVYAPHLMDA